jgi:ATP-dependent Zn protease
VTEKELADLVHHEAAHAVVAVALDVPLDRVTIVQSGDAAGSMSYPPPCLWTIPIPRRTAGTTWLGAW